MFKVMIVDDEYYFRQALKVTLPWNELGFQIAGEAKNGEDAIALMADIQPDVVLVDLNMPIMDGIELMQTAKQRGFSAKFIVLTSHCEFDYAKQALQLGVHHYLLKPIDEREIRGSLLDLRDMILQERSVKLELEGLKRQVQEHIPVLRERLLNEWLQGNFTEPPSSDSERLRYLGIELRGPFYRVVLVDLDENETRFPEEERQLRRLAVRDIAQEYLRNAYSFAGCHDPEDRLAIIIGCPDGSYAKLDSLLEAVRSTIRTAVGSTVTIGVGLGYMGSGGIEISYKEAVYALKHRFVLGGDQIIHYSTIADTGMKNSLFTLEKRSRLLMEMRIGNFAETEQWLAEFFQYARDNNASMDMLLVAGLEIVSTCLEFLAEMSLSFKDVFPDGQPDFIHLVQQMTSFAQWESWVSDLVLKVSTQAHGSKKTRAAKIVEEVKSYIELHYQNEELRIEDIAKSVHMNYNHLCYVFRKETTITIHDYLTEVRMNKAKELFDRGEKMVQSVANRVGYADANYFSKCFKKYAGIPPSQYIRNML